MVKLLLKNRFASLLSSIGVKQKDGSIKKASVGKIILFAILYLYIIAAFLFLSVSMSASMSMILIPQGYSWLYYAIFTIATFSLIFILSIFETKSELFECKDNELLLSMPINPRDIILSRIFTVLIYNYAESLIIMVPAIAFYGVISGDVVGIIGGIIIALFVPLLATSLSSAVGYLVANISKKLRGKSFVSLIFALAFIALYMYGVNALSSEMENLENMDGPLTIPDIPVLRFFGEAALLKPLNTIVLVSVCILGAVVAFTVISKSYIKLVTDTHTSTRAVYKEKRYVKSTALFALVKKELQKFISSAIYMLNAGIGTIMTLIMSVIILVNSGGIFAAADIFMQEGVDITVMLSPMFIAVLVMLSSLNTMAVSSMSLEGKNLWIIKTMPLTGREVILGKTIPQLIITLPTTIISSILLAIAARAELIYIPFFILSPIVACVANAFFCTVIGTALPKFDFENEAQVIKQSLSTMIVTLTQMFLGVIVIIINMFLSLLGFGLVAAVATFGIFVGLCVLFYLLAVNVSAKRYEKFSV